MKSKLYILYLFILCFFFVQCEKEAIKKEYQTGNPNPLVETWRGFHDAVPGYADLDLTTEQALNYYQYTLYRNYIKESVNNVYTFTSTLNPNNTSKLIINNIYNYNLRVEANITNTNEFSIVKAEQLNSESLKEYGVKYISVNGKLETITSANQNNKIDVLRMNIGLYKSDNSVYDTFVLFGFRKTGFEEVNY